VHTILRVQHLHRVAAALQGETHCGIEALRAATVLGVDVPTHQVLGAQLTSECILVLPIRGAWNA